MRKFAYFISACLWLASVSGVLSQTRQPVPGHIQTRWSKDVTPENVWPEYPRPDLRRENGASLNGLWDYAIIGEERAWNQGRVENAKHDPLNNASIPFPEKWDGKILDPYCVESSLSGVAKSVRPNQILWYRLTFQAPKTGKGKETLLHFGAVDWHAVVWVNGRKVGEHRGGYDPFRFDITKSLVPARLQEVVVAVWDPSNMGDQAVGKQSLTEQRKGYRYTPTTGIWQTVWLESVPETYITSLRIVPDVDAGAVRIKATTNVQQPTIRVCDVPLPMLTSGVLKPGKNLIAVLAQSGNLDGFVDVRLFASK